MLTPYLSSRLLLLATFSCIYSLKGYYSLLLLYLLRFVFTTVVVVVVVVVIFIVVVVVIFVVMFVQRQFFIPEIRTLINNRSRVAVAVSQSDNVLVSCLIII